MFKKLYIVENIDTGELYSNWNTGTKFYTRKADAMKLASKYYNRGNKRVVEFELVPTGNVFIPEESNDE